MNPIIELKPVPGQYKHDRLEITIKDKTIEFHPLIDGAGNTFMITKKDLMKYLE